MGVPRKNNSIVPFFRCCTVHIRQIQKCYKLSLHVGHNDQYVKFRYVRKTEHDTTTAVGRQAKTNILRVNSMILPNMFRTIEIIGHELYAELEFVMEY